jgi:phytoene dehydrogenase-like protein
MTTHERTDIVVIGGGVTGASVSYALARAGARVICVERSFPAAGASGASFSVDISSRKTPKAFFDLSVAAAREHAALEHELSVTPWRHPTITLEWGQTAHERTVVRERVQRLRSWGYPAELIERRTRRPAHRGSAGRRRRPVLGRGAQRCASRPAARPPPGRRARRHTEPAVERLLSAAIRRNGPSRGGRELPRDATRSRRPRGGWLRALGVGK